MSGRVLGEMDHRLANIIRFGTIDQLDAVNRLVTVDIGDLVTDWMPWAALRAGADGEYWAPEPGEQVIVFSPSGDIALGFVWGSLDTDATPLPGNTATVSRRKYADGSSVEYDRSSHTLTVNVGSGQVVVNCTEATVNASASTTLNTPTTTCTGDLVVHGNATVQGASTLTGAATMQGGLSVSGGSGSAATIQGSLSTTGDVKAGGISLTGHVHNDPQGGTTGGPQ